MAEVSLFVPKMNSREDLLLTRASISRNAMMIASFAR